ncbi:MAG: hypothetical protein ACI9KN_000155 [Gammaproteobacteria bacterium]|jgi:uncharacterized protein YigA (DUF484 family)
MTEATANPTLAEQTEESKIVDYLQKNPEMLMSYPDVFTGLSIPHQTRGVTSLVERQLKMLRDENQTLKHNMDELVNIARENEELNQRFHRLALELMSCDQLHDVLALVQDQIQTFFYTDYVCFKFLPTINDRKKRLSAHYLNSNSSIGDTVAPWLASRMPVCGQLDAITNAELFGAELKVGSSAIVPLYHTADLGLLCLGSVSTERFNKRMGTIFLQQLGELVSIRLQGLLAV